LNGYTIGASILNVYVEELESLAAQVDINGKVTVTEYNTLEEITTHRREETVRKLSRYNWLCIAPKTYVLALPDASVRVVPTKSKSYVKQQYTILTHHRGEICSQI
jgi:hypothetical protein